MLKTTLSIAMVILLSLNSIAEWQPIDGDVNAPWYGTAKYFSTVEWNNVRWIFAADAMGYFYRSSNEGATWEQQDIPELLDHVCAVLADPEYPDYVYVARYQPGDPYGTNGFWKSTDHGRTFEIQNGDNCNNPPSEVPLGNKKILSIRKYEAGSQSLENHFSDVIVTCFDNAGQTEDDGKMFYHSYPLDQSMCWEQLWPEGQPGEFPAYLDPNTNVRYGISDFAQNIYDEQEYLPEFIVGLIEFGYARPDPEYYGNWRLDSEGWKYILGFPQLGYRVWAGTAFFRYKNSDITTWPIYEFSSKRSDEYYPILHIVPEIYKYNRGGSPLEWNLLTSDNFPGMGYSFIDDDMFDFWDMAVAGRNENENYIFLTLREEYDRYSDPPRPNLSPGIYISSDDGTSWSDNKATKDRGVFFPLGRGVISYPDGPGGPGEDSLLAFLGTMQPQAAGIYGDVPLYGAVYKSTNRGDSWAEVTKHMNTLRTHEVEISHDSVIACGPVPNTMPDSQFFVTMSVDAGSNWQSRFGRQMWASSSAYVRDMKVLPSDPKVIAIAAPFDGDGYHADTMFVSTDWGVNWTAEFGFPITSENMIRSIAAYGNSFYATIDGQDYVLVRVGAWSRHGGPWNVASWGGPRGIDVGPRDGSTITYVGSSGEGIKKLVGSGPDWTNTGLGTGYTDVNVVRIVPGTNSDVVIASATYGGNKRLVRTTDGGTNWLICDSGIPQEYRNIQAIQPMPGEPRVILATGVNSSLQGKCFISLDMGKYWAEFDEGNALPPVYMKDIAFWSSLVHNGKIAYIGTDAGLYKSSIIVADPIISSDTTWTSDKSICLTGDLTISSEATLTIQPGTNIYIATNADGSASGADTNRVEIIVNGALNAAGTSSEHIRFVPCVAGDIADTAEWYGIVVNSSGSATLRYCEVERAIYGVKGNAAALDVRHTNFRYIADSGIYSTSTSNNAVVDSNTFERCYDWAVDISQGTGHDIIGNGISDCRGGIRYASSGGATALDVQYSDIDNAFFAQVGEGIHLESGGTITANITANTATGFKRGIYLSKVIGGAVTGNDAHDNNAQGLYLVNCSVSLVCQVSTFNSFCQNGIGISVNGSSVMPVAYNKIEGNTTYGVYVAPMSMPDFGTDGTATGHNAIVNTAAQYDFYRDTGPTVKAENCWWGGGKGKTYGSVDNTPYLTTDPLPRRGLDIGATLPEDVVLMKSYPNPFNPSATIEFSLPRDGRVSIEIFNIMGQRVKTLANATYTAGMHSLVWNGADEIGRAVASGIYLAMLSGEEFRGSVKMTLLR